MSEAVARAQAPDRSLVLGQDDKFLEALQL
jgi:hypothetical protein